VTIGVLKKLVESGRIASDEVIVAYITGIGLKTVEAVENALDGLQVIKPSVADFNDKILRRNPSLGQ
jgi:threonine synthase